jgi:hypothetical protein
MMLLQRNGFELGETGGENAEESPPQTSNASIFAGSRLSPTVTSTMDGKIFLRLAQVHRTTSGVAIRFASLFSALS